MSIKAYFPERVAIDFYGNGGFRFAEMSHTGSILILPDGIHGWYPVAFEEITPDDFRPLFDAVTSSTFVLFGTGAKQQWPGRKLKAAFARRNIAVEVMDTGAAVRTYNVLLAEQRPVAAALLAVESYKSQY